MYVYSTFGRYTLDAVSAISFALDIQAQTRDDNPFLINSRKFLEFSFGDIGMLLQGYTPVH